MKLSFWTRGAVLALAALPLMACDREVGKKSDEKREQIGSPALPVSSELVIQPGSAAANEYFTQGWYKPEGERRWTSQPIARIRLPRTEGPISRIVIEGRAIVAMNVDIVLNDSLLGVFESDGKTYRRKEFFVPAKDLKSENILEISVPMMVAPSSVIPASKDTRMLGMMLTKLTLIP